MVTFRWKNKYRVVNSYEFVVLDVAGDLSWNQ